MQVLKDQQGKVKDMFPASRHDWAAQVHVLTCTLALSTAGLAIHHCFGMLVSHNALILTLVTFVLPAGGRAGGPKSRIEIARGRGNRLYIDNKHACTLQWPITHANAFTIMKTQHFVILTSGVLAFREHSQLFAPSWAFPSRFRPVKLNLRVPRAHPGRVFTGSQISAALGAHT